MIASSTLSDRQASGAFVLGCVAVTAGVLLHLPMFLMARSMGYRLAGMPMDAGMLIGLALIVGGAAVAAYGLLPRDLAAQRAAASTIVIAAPEDAPLADERGEDDPGGGAVDLDDVADETGQQTVLRGRYRFSA